MKRLFGVLVLCLSILPISAFALTDSEAQAINQAVASTGLQFSPGNDWQVTREISRRSGSQPNSSLVYVELQNTTGQVAQAEFIVTSACSDDNSQCKSSAFENRLTGPN